MRFAAGLVCFVLAVGAISLTCETMRPCTAEMLIDIIDLRSSIYRKGERTWER